MKVLHLSSERTWRGGEQQISYLIQYLNSKGVENLVAAKKDSEMARRMKCLELPFANELDLYTAWNIRELCKLHKVDILHMHSGHSHSLGVLSSLLGNPAKLVLSKRTDYPIKNNWFSRFKFNYQKIERILCVSQKIKNVVAKGLDDPSKAVTVYSGIDFNRFPEIPLTDIRNILKLPKDAKVIINSSAISKQKDLKTFIETARIVLKNKDCYFVICGQGPQEEEIKNLVKEYQLEDRILFTGFRKDLPTFLGSADIFFISSEDEGLGTSILDAFAVGLPVVATRAGGIPELVHQNETGLSADVKDSQSLAVLIENLLDNSPLKERLAAEAKEFAKKFSYQSTGEETLEVYQEILN